MTTLTIRSDIAEPQYLGLTIGTHATSDAKIFADITDLVKLNNATGQLDEDTLVCDLPRFFEAPGVNRERDLRLWKDINGKLIGFGQLSIPDSSHEIKACLYFDVHPAWRGSTLETEILRWGEQRMREVAKEHFLPVKVRISSRDDQVERQVLLEKQGFTNERCFLTMACSLAESVSSSLLPTGFTMRSLSIEPDISAWVELFNESFIDHWDHHDLTVATVKQWLKNPPYRPELNLIAVAPDSTFTAFCTGYINQEENARSGRNEGWIKLLGTRRGFRKLGLGRSILLAGMQKLKIMGVESVKLAVDAQSLTSATQLYQSVGFKSLNTWLSYVKEVSSYSPNL